MTPEEIFPKVRDLLVLNLGVAHEQIQESSRFAEDLQADSLDVVELIMCFEEEFGIDIPDEDAEKIATVSDAITYIAKHAD